jgi:hypothetical protein
MAGLAGVRSTPLGLASRKETETIRGAIRGAPAKVAQQAVSRPSNRTEWEFYTGLACDYFYILSAGERKNRQDVERPNAGDRINRGW